MNNASNVRFKINVQDHMETHTRTPHGQKLEDQRPLETGIFYSKYGPKS